jgi:hypothetical protein
MQKQIEFILSAPINIAQNGTFVECEKLIMFAPSYSVVKHSLKLKQFVMQAINEQLEKSAGKPQANDKQDEEIKAEQVLGMLAMSSVDLNQAFDSFKAIAISGAVKTESLVVINEAMLNQMSAEDVEMLMMNYLAFFCLSSLLQKMKS